MTTIPKVNDGLGSLPLDGRLIPLSKNENVDGVAFVSGMQGVVATTFLVEEVTIPLGEKTLKRVYGSATLVIPMDIFTIGELTPKWKIS